MIIYTLGSAKGFRTWNHSQNTLNNDRPLSSNLSSNRHKDWKSNSDRNNKRKKLLIRRSSTLNERIVRKVNFFTNNKNLGEPIQA